MTVGYHKRRDGGLVPDYACQREGIATATPICQNICGAGVDAAVADLVLQTLTPLALDVAPYRADGSPGLLCAGWAAPPSLSSNRLS